MGDRTQEREKPRSTALSDKKGQGAATKATSSNASMSPVLSGAVPLNRPPLSCLTPGPPAPETLCHQNQGVLTSGTRRKADRELEPGPIWLDLSPLTQSGGMPAPFLGGGTSSAIYPGANQTILRLRPGSPKQNLTSQAPSPRFQVRCDEATAPLWVNGGVGTEEREIA